MPNKGGSLANENSFPDKSAKTISPIRMNMVPPGGSAIEPAKKNKQTYFKSSSHIFTVFFPKDSRIFNQIVLTEKKPMTGTQLNLVEKIAKIQKFFLVKTYGCLKNKTR